MPTIPTVFRPVRSNDVQIRPFKAYKSYRLLSGNEYSASGYRVHNALHNVHDVYIGDTSYNYPVNSIDGTNQHVIWKSLDHRYYRFPYDATRCHELTNVRTTEKYLHYSASILTIPYFDLGEQVKPGSVNLQSKPVGTIRHTLTDDGNGNLRDLLINTASFASASNLMFYMSFNNEYRKFEKQFGTITNGSVEYILDKQQLNAVASNVSITTGVTDSKGNPSGIAAGFNSNSSYIRIPHTDRLNQFNNTDAWTISFWYYVNSPIGSLPTESEHVLISKYTTRTEQYIPPTTKVLTTRDVNLSIPPSYNSVSSWNKLRTPFHIEYYIDDAPDSQIMCTISNGTTATRLSAGTTGTEESWNHVVITNNGDTCRMFFNGVEADSTVIPIGSTANNADVIVGNYSTNGNINSIPINLDEIRFYDYGIAGNEVESLYSNHYLSGSLYQTNVAGNVFYRNGQVVVSSPLAKYNSGSGFFSNEWTASWKGTHTIYENEVMVRIPSDQFNYTMNPSATYRPTSNLDSTNVIEKYNGAGELFKSMFTSSFISPYITTVGLYNDKAQLLAVGKLAQPVQKRDDVDMNIIVRWDY